MMDEVVKGRIIKIGCGVLLALGCACWLTPDSGEDEADMLSRQFKKEVSKHLAEANEKMATRSEVQDDYKVEALLNAQKSHRSRLEENQQKADEIKDYVDGCNGEPQPQHVIDACTTRIAQLPLLNNEQKQEQQKAESLYETTLAHWEKLAARPDTEADTCKRMEELCAELEKQLTFSENGKKTTKPDWESRRVYVQQIKRIKRCLALLRAELDIRREKQRETESYRNQVIGADGKVDHTKPKMQEVDAVMEAIRGYEPHPESLLLPSLKPAPPPPVFKPDMVLAATGDLPEELLMPLVELWLRENKATPLKGKRFTWEISKKGNREIEVNAPAGIQGKEAGKLRIRVLSVLEKEQAFASVSASGNVDLLLTGQRPTRDMLAGWLPEGKSLQQLDAETQGRSFRARVCYDALVFFRGNQLEVSSIRSAVLKDASKPKVFSMSDKARKEAVDICGVSPGLSDVNEPASMSREALCAKYADKMILGVWHKDAAGNIFVKDVPTICYAAGWESEAAQKNIPPDYRPEKEGVSPTPENIASGRYAYGYSIYFYRSTRDTESRAAALSRSLLTFAANAEDNRVAALISSRGFVPVRLGVDSLSRSNRLTRDDLPLPVLFSKMGAKAEEYGYDPQEAKWVYGVRVSMPLYYETGSAEASENGVLLDPDAAYYTSTQAFARIREAVGKEKAMVVVLGHADPQWGKKLDVDVRSWKENLKLSEKRAQIVSTKKVKPQMSDSSELGHESVGSGWARPACDISLARSVDEQENELSRCRRVEVFIIFPVPGAS